MKINVIKFFVNGELIHTYRTYDSIYSVNTTQNTEEIKETTEEECQFCKRFDEILCVCFDYPELSIEDARKKCAINTRDFVRGV